MIEPMNEKQCVDSINFVKSLLVDLDLTNPTVQYINEQAKAVQSNFNKATLCLVDARLNLSATKSLLRNAKLDESRATSRAYMSDVIRAQKSQDLRKEACNIAIELQLNALLIAENAYSTSEAYYEAAKYVYENLKDAQSVLKEQIKLLNGEAWAARGA